MSRLEQSIKGKIATIGVPLKDWDVHIVVRHRQDTFFCLNFYTYTVVSSDSDIFSLSVPKALFEGLFLHIKKRRKLLRRKAVRMAGLEPARL